MNDGNEPEREENDGRKPLPPGTRCAGHPDREAAAACEECAKPVCAECAPLKGGGRCFCRECLAASRLVAAEPGVIGAPAPETEAPPAPARPARPARSGTFFAVLAFLTLLAAAVAFFLFWRHAAG